MSNVAIKIENLRKRYKLGAIGGRTLNAELQSWWARKRGKEDPNTQIGQDTSRYGETFWALDGINLEIKKGEAIGIIGANGAGKSTLLKILSRVTAPTEGDVWIDGRVASMLEVGTGFHGELTGRENIYMNGAILGMTRKEVDAKIESIIDFSECRQFIDTPVKRYSSGMYVKLAFAVASHLDAEIMVMDEVLAVGDMAFQKKCLGKMGDDAKGGKTVLYVSHNMATIRSLCTRCIVLNNGKIIFDGDVEEGISAYMENCSKNLVLEYNFQKSKRHAPILGVYAKINIVKFVGKSSAVYTNDEKVTLEVKWSVFQKLRNIEFTANVEYIDGTPIGLAEIRESLSDYERGDKISQISFDFCNLANGVYVLNLHISRVNDDASINDLDEVDKILFEMVDNRVSIVWQRRYWGSIHLNDCKFRMIS